MTVIIKDRDPRKYQQLLDRHPGLLDRYPRLLDGYPGGGYRGGPIRRPRPAPGPRRPSGGRQIVRPHPVWPRRPSGGRQIVRPRSGWPRPVKKTEEKGLPVVGSFGFGGGGSPEPAAAPTSRPYDSWRPRENPRARPRGPGYQGSRPRPYFPSFGNRLRAGGRVAGRNKYGTPYPTISPRPGLPKDGPRPGSMRR